MLQLDGIGPLHQQIYRAFRNDILSGVLAPGERVPSTRALADLLKVSRNTAVSAYEQLFAEGYLERQEQLWRLFYHRSALLCGPRRRLACKDARPGALARDSRSRERES